MSRVQQGRTLEAPENFQPKNKNPGNSFSGNVENCEKVLLMGKKWEYNEQE